MTDMMLRPGRFARARGPVLVVVMDGFGIGPDDDGNAICRAHTPVLDGLLERYSHVPLRAHGTMVGLPSDGDMGNSEVGHNALGAGRVFEQGAKLVNRAIETGAMYEGRTWRWLIDGVRESGEPLHFIGLLSDGNVHSHQDHLYAMLRHAHASGVPRVRVHPLLDGRDVGETSALVYFDRLEAVLAEINATGDRDYRIASGGGRMVVTMDRYEADWRIVERGWQHHVRGEGRQFASAREAIETVRAEQPGVVDQFFPGFVIGEAGEAVGPIRDGASVIYFNFRGDRAIEITRAFEDDALDAFDRGPRPAVRYAGMMQYDGDLGLPSRFLVEPPTIDRTLGEHLARNGVRQFACSETQKFGHVTYFWNGNRSGRFDDELETYVEVPSDVIPFEHKPEMKAKEIVDATLEALGTGRFEHARINFANGDMVGHTGVRDAAITAVEAVDRELGRLLEGLAALGGVAIVTADHGNADEMYSRDKKTGGFQVDAGGRIKPLTSHTLNPVPCVLFDPERQFPEGIAAIGEIPGLANIAATVAELLGFEPPADYLPSLLR